MCYTWNENQVQPSVSYYVMIFSPQVKFKQTAVDPRALFCYRGSRFIWSDAISHYLLLPKALRGRTAPRQNHGVGETYVHPWPFCSDNLTLDSCHLPVPKGLFQLLIALDLPSVFQGTHPISFCPVLLWLYNFLAHKNVQWLPKKSQASKVLPPFLWSLVSHCSPPVSTTDGSPTSPFLFTHLFPCCSFCLSRPSPLISIHGNSNHHSGLHSAVSPPSAFPNRSQPLSSTPHPYSTYGPYNILLCIIIVMYVSCLQGGCWAFSKCNLI